MRKQLRAKALTLYLVLGVILATAVPALARVSVKGYIHVFNPIVNEYQPLKHARVRLVLAEYTDIDTLDVEGTTDDRGYYSLSKGNAWWRSGYDAYLIVFAEAPGKLEIQTEYMQVDGYQAWTDGFFAKDNRNTRRDVKIGGDDDNVADYRFGGIAALGEGTTSGASDTRGARAFVIYNEMTDHRKQLVAKALGNGDFEEKEVSYPAGGAVGSYVVPWDYIKIPDHYFTSSDLPRLGLVCRHELSHGIMADAFWTMPGWWTGEGPGSHNLAKVADIREFAWSEAWAEFLAEVTQQPRYGNYHDFETRDAGWRSGIPAGCDRTYVEGELAAAMWDIYDGEGWEKRQLQTNDLPGDEMFYDGLSDPQLHKIWRIMSEFHPHGFARTTYAGYADSFVHYWLEDTSYGKRHELKAILFNRNLVVPGVTDNNKPTVTVGNPQWNVETATASIPITVTEQDPEDRARVRLEVFLNDAKVESRWLSESNWNGASQSVTVEQEVMWAQGDPVPQLAVAVHDNMQASWVKQPLPVPPAAQTGGLLVEIKQVRVQYQRLVDGEPQYDLNSTVGPLTVQIGVSGGYNNFTLWSSDNSTWTTIPPTGGFSPHIGGQIFHDPDYEAFRTNKLPDHISMVFTVKGRIPTLSPSVASVELGRMNRTHTREDNYGLDMHQVDILDREIIVPRPGVSALNNPRPPDPRLKITVLYRIKSLRPTPEFSVVLMTPTAQGMLPPVVGMIPLGLLGGQEETSPDIADLTPGALACRSSQLLDEYARLQGEAYELAQVLEHRLARPPRSDPKALKGSTPDRTKSGTVRPDAGRTKTRITKGRTVTARRGDVRPVTTSRPTKGVPRAAVRDGILKIPSTKTLDKAVKGRLAVTTLTKEQRQHLQGLQQMIAQRQARLPQIPVESAALRDALNGALTKMQSQPQVSAKDKKDVKTRISRLTRRLDTIGPSVHGVSRLLAKERTVVQKGLKLKAK